MTYGRRMKKAMAIFDPLTLKIGTSLLLIAKSGTQRSNDVSFCADHTRMEYIHATPLLLCLVSFLSHFGES